MKMKLIVLGCCITALLAGCTTSQQLRMATAEVEQAAITANDFQLNASEKGLCSSSLSAIKRRWGDDPQKLRYVLGICGWSDHNMDVMTGNDFAPMRYSR